MTDVVSGRGDHRIVPYDPAWPERARAIATRLKAALGPVAVRIEHIGSTAVPELAARPIPDIQIAVRDVRDHDSFIPALEKIGYAHFRFPELDVEDYLVLVPADGSNREHIQVCEADSHQELRHLAVRDFLRSHPHERVAYERVKREAAVAANGERSVYSKGKDAFVHALEERALQWSRSKDDVRSVLSSDGTRIHFEVRGQGPTIVLLHGLACRRRMWDAVARHLVAAGWRVVVPDLRGHGDSMPVEGDYAIEQLGADTIAVLRDLGASSAALVGHSAGGIQAIVAAAAATDEGISVSAVVTLGTSLSLNRPRERALLWFSATRVFYWMLSAPGLGRLVVRFGAFGRSAEARSVRQTLEDAKACPRPTKRAWVRTMTGRSFVGLVRGLDTMVALGGGDKDATFSVRRLRTSLVGDDGVETFLIPGVGHMAPLEDPEVVAQQILEYLT